MNDDEFKQLKNNWETSDIKEKLIILEKIGNETILKIKTLQKENEKLQEKIDKAIEYIKKEEWYLEEYDNNFINENVIKTTKLLDILKGDSNGNR